MSLGVKKIMAVVGLRALLGVVTKVTGRRTCNEHRQDAQTDTLEVVDLGLG